jgi:hypothetical protein
MGGVAGRHQLTAAANPFSPDLPDNASTLADLGIGFDLSHNLSTFALRRSSAPHITTAALTGNQSA